MHCLVYGRGIPCGEQATVEKLWNHRVPMAECYAPTDITVLVEHLNIS